MKVDTENKRSADLAIFIPSFRGGGAEKNAVLLANEITKMGYKVDLIVTSDEGPFANDVDSTVNIVNFDCVRVLSALIPLSRYLRQSPPRALLSFMKHANLISILAKLLSNTKTRLVISEQNSPSHAGKWLDRYVLAPVISPLLYPLADAIVCVSDGVRRDLSKTVTVNEEKLLTIHNPVDLENIEQQAREELSDPWLDDPEIKTLITTGRLVPQKDFYTLLRAVATIPKHLNWKLIVLGTGSLEHELKTLAAELGLEENIKWQGFVQNPFKWMARSDLFVMSSAWEGFGNVLIEAMACGTQVISTNCPSGPSEILEDGKWGTLVAVGDHTALAEAITHQLTTPVFKNVRVRSAHFGSPIVLENYLEVLSL